MRIAFGTKANSGKDTSGAFVKSILDGETILISFAKGIYDICDQIQHVLNKPIVKDRKLLRFIGMGLRDIYDENIWIDLVDKKIKDNVNKNIIITDLRFRTEYEYLKKNKFILVNIIRANNKSDDHISEIDLDGASFDYCIYNDGTLKDLYDKLTKLINDINSNNESNV